MCSLQEHIEREIRAREAEKRETADPATSATTGSNPIEEGPGEVTS